MRNLIIADSQDVTRIGIKHIVEELGLVDKMFEVGGKSELIDLLLQFNNPIVILDYSLFDILSVNELQIIQDRFPESSWILFSDELSNNLLNQLIILSVKTGIVLKSSVLSEITEAIKAAVDYDNYICSRVGGDIKTLSKNVIYQGENNLTYTEIEILKGIAQGKTTKEMAAERNLSFHTVITHRKNIFRKLEVNNIHEATKYAMRAGIIDDIDYYI